MTPSPRLPVLPALALAGILTALAAKAGTAQSAEAAPWLERCGQLVLVVTERWESEGGVLVRLERTPNGWRELGRAAATVGRKGMGLGLGLHPEGLPGPLKEEGDRRAPAGVFRLEFAFGAAPLAPRAFPYRRTTGADLWVDDPRSVHYNRWIVAGDPSVRPDWGSAEVLRRGDGLYDYAVSIAHNREAIVPGRGSAIFLHAWSAPGRPTIGCTALEKARVRELVEWLDEAREPVLVQGPRGLLPRLGLPQELLAFAETTARQSAKGGKGR
jgi:L,D-peptidoglycan transpeptidase YkuD (ErfK/YbiS/YcfS/YnhG family)